MQSPASPDSVRSAVTPQPSRDCLLLLVSRRQPLVTTSRTLPAFLGSRSTEGEAARVARRRSSGDSSFVLVHPECVERSSTRTVARLISEMRCNVWSGAKIITSNRSDRGNDVWTGRNDVIHKGDLQSGDEDPEWPQKAEHREDEKGSTEPPNRLLLLTIASLLTREST